MISNFSKKLNLSISFLHRNACKYVATAYHIKSILKSLSSNKSHGWDKLSIKMIKMCNKTFVYPLKLNFKASIQEGPFPDCCTYSKKESKNLLKTIDQLAFFFFYKIYERIIFKELFNNFHQNQLFTKCQSRFLWFSKTIL